jgi:hypothetical protein
MWPFIETNAAAMGTLSDCAAPSSSVVIIGAGILQRDELATARQGGGSSNGRFQPAISRRAAV